MKKRVLIHFYGGKCKVLVLTMHFRGKLKTAYSHFDSYPKHLKLPYEQSQHASHIKQGFFQEDDFGEFICKFES